MAGKKARERAEDVGKRLAKEYGDVRTALHYDDAFQLLVATILSAQATDKKVNEVTPGLFERYPKPRALADSEQEDVEEIIHSLGFFRNKAKHIRAAAAAIADEHSGEVPAEMDLLTELPGVARKTAAVVLGNAFGRNEGIPVDTHVKRLSQRLGFTKEDKNTDKIERQLMELFAREHWTSIAHQLIEHGRAVCGARSPKCAECFLSDICPSANA